MIGETMIIKTVGVVIHKIKDVLVIIMKFRVITTKITTGSILIISGKVLIGNHIKKIIDLEMIEIYPIPIRIQKRKKALMTGAKSSKMIEIKQMEIITKRQIEKADQNRMYAATTTNTTINKETIIISINRIIAVPSSSKLIIEL